MCHIQLDPNWGGPWRRNKPAEGKLHRHKHPGPGDGGASPSYPGHARNCPHVAFWDATAPEDAPARRSVEVRMIAAFPKTKARLRKCVGSAPL